MSDSYEELSKRATKGDKQALRELFSLGEKLFSDQQFQQAAAVFKDSAISYRILAFRQGARAEDAEKNAASLEIARQIYQAWIEKNPSGLRKTPFPAPPGADLSRIRDIVYENLIHDSTLFPLFEYLFSVLHKFGVEFFLALRRHRQKVMGFALRVVWSQANRIL